MPNETILQQIRTPLASALSSVAGNVYAFVPETVIIVGKAHLPL